MFAFDVLQFEHSRSGLGAAVEDGHFAILAFCMCYGIGSRFTPQFLIGCARWPGPSNIESVSLLLGLERWSEEEVRQNRKTRAKKLSFALCFSTNAHTGTCLETFVRAPTKD